MCAVTFVGAGWQPLPRVGEVCCCLGWDSFWKILCSIKDFPITQIRGKAKYGCNISNSKHHQPVWDWISSCRCVCAMVGWWKVFIHMWRGQCVVEKEWNDSYLICFCQPLTTLLLSALVGGFGVLPDQFFHSEHLIADSEPWCGLKLLRVNAKQEVQCAWLCCVMEREGDCAQ